MRAPTGYVALALRSFAQATAMKAPSATAVITMARTTLEAGEFGLIVAFTRRNLALDVDAATELRG